MIVCQHAAIETRRLEAIGIRGRHTVVHALARPGIVARGNACFEIDDTRVRSDSVQDRERLAPDVRGFDGSRNVTALALGERYIVDSVLDIGLVEGGVAGVRQNLIDAPSGHNIAAKKQRQVFLINRELTSCVWHRSALAYPHLCMHQRHASLKS